jgi:plasmid stability protein
MAQLLVRQLDEETKERLRRRAERHGRSMEAEARDILRAALAAEAVEPTEGLGTRIARLFAEVGLTEEEYEAFRAGTEAFRGEPARFVEFEE